MAKFRQINKGQPDVHHDALEFPDGQTVLLTQLCEGQRATVLQLPALPLFHHGRGTKAAVARSLTVIAVTLVARKSDRSLELRVVVA